ncbi:MAG: UvrD-helicase domain-containing protein [Polyangia bacterium]
MSKRMLATDPGVEVVVAPAGSGKTTLLIYHFLRLLKAGIPVERLVAITFTRKAAAELLQRLAQVLRGVVAPAEILPEKLAEAKEMYGHVLPAPVAARSALSMLDAAPVSTVDSFALSLVQEFLLDASFALSDGTRALIDGPVVSGGDTASFYEAAARAQIEALGKPAHLLLEEMTFTEAIEGVARLATCGLSEVLSISAVLEAVGKELTPVVRKDRDTWLALADKYPRVLAAWLRAPKGVPPVSLLSMLADAKGEMAVDADEVVKKAVRALGWRAEGGFTGLGVAMRRRLEAWSDDKAAVRCDRVRLAMLELAGRARDAALREIARSGSLGYEEILRAATELCESPPAQLADRYDALLVDELQDTNPAQLAFYKAFVKMRGGKKPIRWFFVGDTRQSIYRFRQADPFGWQSLVDIARKHETLAELTINYRSSQLLIEAQHELFGRLAKASPGSVDPLDDLEPRTKAPKGEIGDSQQPALIVDAPEIGDVEPYVLAEFAARVKARWAEPKFAKETAAVLVRSWAKGAWAAETLRGHGLRVQVTGDRALLVSRPAADLRLFLRVLIDPSDDIAVAGVCKHPSVGLGDRAIMLLRHANLFGRLLAPDVDLTCLEKAEADGLRPVLDSLRRARDRIGREPTADVLERLLAELHVRPVIAAGPEGEGDVGVAQLDILLDIVRSHESDTVDPQAVLEKLSGDGLDGAEDLPVVRMHHAEQVVTVTTVFGAKGLEFDHVALLQVEKGGSDGSVKTKAFSVFRPQGSPLLSMALDPTGGIAAELDPLSVIARVAGGDEGMQEGLRMLYVGFTRARTSVTLGLKKAGTGIVPLLRKVLAEGPITGVTTVEPDDRKLRPAVPLQRQRTGVLRPFESCWAEPDGFVLTRPSSAAELGLDGKALAAEFRARATIVSALAGLPMPAGAGLDAVSDIVWGSVVHGWLERWAFDGTPTAAQAVDYLRERWSSDDKSVADWLVALGLGLRDRLPGFKALLDQKQRLHFEWPLVAVDGNTIWRGRTDLVVEFPGREVAIIDFKAGSKFATETEIPGVESYAAQLEGYRRMLEAGRYHVREVGLMYVRGPSWVRAAYAA